ncbi:MAG TPA: glycosyltransferase, partial [Thermoanaerobaculia bacterium]|nr:glycosyltransferase [Thermoanaerobaculia bacterium]
MSRVLVCGVAPLPVENTLQNYGPGMRSWQFARGLTLRGHTVRLVTMRIANAYGSRETVRRERIEGIDVERLNEAEFFDRREIERRIEDFRPDALVGATIYGSSALAACRTELPFWADQFGHVMAEAQARAALDRDDGVLGYFWHMARQVGLRADRISTVSERQRYAAIGELGALGRLDAASCGYEYVSVVPCAVVTEPAAKPAEPVFRGTRVPDDSFVVLWGGSYNVWSDVETLFAGLAAAMAEEPRIHFVSTGGAVEGHDDRTYPALCEAIARSELRHRFHLDGWVPAERVHGYVAEADL